jgi:hypothetical protein
VARVLAVVPDLLLASRVEESLAAAGHDVTVAPSLPDPVRADAIVCDLDAADPDRIAATGLPSLGFHSHLDVETKARGQKAGVTVVVPRSRMSRELPQLVQGLLDQP